MQQAMSVNAGLNAARDFLVAGKLGEAETLLTKLKATSAPHPILHEYLGFIAVQRSDPKKAVRHYRKAVKLSPLAADLQAKLAEALALSGAEAEAETLAREAVALDPQNVAALNLLAKAAWTSGRGGEARDYLDASVQADPAQFEAWHNLGRFCLELGQSENAVRALHKARALMAQNRQNLLYLSEAQIAIGETDAAIVALEEARALSPSADDEDVLLRLGEAHWRALRFDEAAAMAETLLAASPDHARAKALKAKSLEGLGQHSEALEIIRAVRQVIDPQTTHWFPKFVEAQCLLGLKRHNEAATAFREANAIEAETFRKLGANKDIFRGYADQAIEIFSPSKTALWSPAPDPDAGQGMAFINGFPRSGTTLIDAILRTHSKVAIAEESSAAETCWKRAEQILPAGYDGLGSMSKDNADILRVQYLETLRDRLSADPTDRLVIDRHATGTMQAGLMKRLFPKATFFLMLRHPCDAVLSAWFRNFRPNNHTANYLKVEAAATFYDRLMTLHETLEESLGLGAHWLRYEDLITDLRGTLEPALEKMGLSWEDQLAEHHSAKNRPNRTASFAQVAKPLYQSAKYRFHHYRSTLEPVMPILEPWIEKFGYGETP